MNTQGHPDDIILLGDLFKDWRLIGLSGGESLLGGPGVEIHSPITLENLFEHSSTTLLTEGFQFKLDCLAPKDCSSSNLLDTSLSFQVGQRIFNGRIHFIHQGDQIERDYRPVHLTLIPWLELLKLKSDFRVFEQLTSIEIFKKICQEHSLFDFKIKVSNPVPKRMYCVQANESSYHFVNRLFEEDGLFYTYQHSHDRHVLTLYDTSMSLQRVDYETSYLNPPLWHRENHFRVCGIQSQGFNSSYPKKSVQAHCKIKGHPLHNHSFEQHLENPKLTQETLAKMNQRIAQRIEWHTRLIYIQGDLPGIETGTHIKLYSPKHRKELSILIIAQGYHLYSDSDFNSSVHSRSDDTTLSTPGFGFKAHEFEADAVDSGSMRKPNNEVQRKDHFKHLFEHRTIPGLNEVKAHEFEADAVDSGSMKKPNNEVQRKDHFKHGIVIIGIESEWSYIPLQNTPQPNLYGYELAKVMGQDPNTVETDAWGRVKIRLRLERHEAPTHYFAPVLQAWFGAQFIPRVGDTVVIGFLQNSPDHPVILGSLFQNHEPPPANSLTSPSENATGHQLIFSEDGGILLKCQGSYTETIQGNHVQNSAQKDELHIQGQAQLSIQKNFQAKANEISIIVGSTKVKISKEGIELKNT